jgi:hypothetical protein
MSQFRLNSSPNALRPKLYIVEYTIFCRLQAVAKVVLDFKKSAINHIFKASQRPKGTDLSGMIIVDSTIFLATLNALSENDLQRLLADYPLRPATSELSDVSNWCSLYFYAVSQMSEKIKTQTDFGEGVGLSQGDVSSLMTARKGFYFGEDRIESLFNAVKSMILSFRKKAS